MIDTVLLDLGNTLVRYYTREQWPDVRLQCIKQVARVLKEEGVVCTSLHDALAGVADYEYIESEDCRVQPLADRLQALFGLNNKQVGSPLMERACRAFMEPIFTMALVYDDVPGALSGLRTKGLRLAIVSNTPWGSPPHLWREELGRLGLAERVDAAFFCGDVGWRKPDRRVFEYVLGELDAPAQRCLFVGDDPRWDVVGPRRVGMRAVLIDRKGGIPNDQAPAIRSLCELGHMLQEERT